MNYLLLYYSGAGNTEYISGKIQKALRERGESVTAKRITSNNLDGGDHDFDILGIGFPTYFRESPELIQESIRRSNGRNRPIFFYCTKGMYSGNAVRNLISLSLERDFVPRGHMEFYMPGSDALLLFARKGSVVERLLKAVHTRKIDIKINRFLSSLSDGSRAPVPPRKWYTALDDGVVKYFEAKATDGYRIFVGQFRSLEDRCIRCELCVGDCPRNNIELTDAGIEFGDSCDRCFRCIHHCPTEAIQIAGKTVDTVRYRPMKDLTI